MGAFYIIRIIEREAAESAAARRRPDDHDALDATRGNPSIVRRVFAAMRHSADRAPGGAGRHRPEAGPRGAGALGVRPGQPPRGGIQPQRQAAGRAGADGTVQLWEVSPYAA
jgi:hypothetical protein